MELFQIKLVVGFMVKNWNQLLPKFIFRHKHLEGNFYQGVRDIG